MAVYQVDPQALQHSASGTQTVANALAALRPDTALDSMQNVLPGSQTADVAAKVGLELWTTIHRAGLETQSISKALSTAASNYRNADTQSKVK